MARSPVHSLIVADALATGSCLIVMAKGLGANDVLAGLIEAHVRGPGLVLVAGAGASTRTREAQLLLLQAPRGGSRVRARRRGDESGVNQR